MAKKEYLPTTDKDKAAWLKNFASKLPGYASTLNISAEDLQSISNDADAFAFILECSEMVKTYSLQMTSFKDALKDGMNSSVLAIMPQAPAFPPQPKMVPEGIFIRVRRLVQNIKSQKNYTDDIGKALAIIGETIVVNYDNLKPELSAFISGGKVVVKWKKGAAQSLNVYMKKGAGEYQFVANDSKPPYDDPTPLPAEPTTWYYKAMYVIDDVEVGQVSNEVSVLVQKLF